MWKLEVKANVFFFFSLLRLDLKGIEYFCVWNLCVFFVSLYLHDFHEEKALVECDSSTVTLDVRVSGLSKIWANKSCDLFFFRYE